jgi:hypothetical protein
MSGGSVIRGPEELVMLWRSTADTLELFGGSVQAEAVRQCAKMLEESLQTAEDELLTLGQAERLSGYSAHHLGRMLREGRIPNAGRRHAPRIRTRDLPRRPRRLTASRPVPHLLGATPGQIARAVVNSDSRGG